MINRKIDSIAVHLGVHFAYVSKIPREKGESNTINLTSFILLVSPEL